MLIIFGKHFFLFNRQVQMSHASKMPTKEQGTYYVNRAQTLNRERNFGLDVHQQCTLQQGYFLFLVIARLI